jgi:hypothetical protein
MKQKLTEEHEEYRKEEDALRFLKQMTQFAWRIPIGSIAVLMSQIGVDAASLKKNAET